MESKRRRDDLKQRHVFRFFVHGFFYPLSREMPSTLNG